MDLVTCGHSRRPSAAPLSMLQRWGGQLKAWKYSQIDVTKVILAPSRYQSDQLAELTRKVITFKAMLPGLKNVRVSSTIHWYRGGIPQPVAFLNCFHWPRLKYQRFLKFRLQASQTVGQLQILDPATSS